MPATPAPVVAPIAFFTEAREVEHLVITKDGIQKRMGKPAVIPALPGFGFFFRIEGTWAILTEAKSGRMMAGIASPNRSALQCEVSRIIRQYGATGVHAAVKAAFPSMP